MNPRSLRQSLRVAVLIALVGLWAAPRGLVLCVGDAGHVSIEAALEVVPCQPVGDDTRFGSEPTESCIDTPLLSEVLKATGDFEVVWTPVAIITPTPRPFAISTASPPSPADCSVLSLWLREHRTIVLLV